MIAIRPRHRWRTAVSVVLGLAMSLLVASGALARTPVDPDTLTPAPPDFFGAECFTQGVQIVCTLAFSDPPVVDEPSGIVCDGVELTFSQERDVVGKRFYTANGLLRQRHFREDMRGTLDHPVSGASLDFVQGNTIIHDLAVPGDVGTGVSRIVGASIRVSRPDGGTVLSDAGWVAIDEATGEIAGWAGPHRFDDYFARGDAHALDAICEAIAD